jgi:hypothetical protein
METSHEPVPEQAPVHPVKTEPAAGVAVRVIVDPAVYAEEQVPPQLMPAGVDVTVPLPLPLFTIFRVYEF